MVLEEKHTSRTAWEAQCHTLRVVPTATLIEAVRMASGVSHYVCTYCYNYTTENNRTVVTYSHYAAGDIL